MMYKDYDYSRRDRGRERDRDRDRYTERDRDRDRERDKERGREREGDRDRDRDMRDMMGRSDMDPYINKDRIRERDSDRDRGDRDRERYRIRDDRDRDKERDRYRERESSRDREDYRERNRQKNRDNREDDIIRGGKNREYEIDRNRDRDRDRRENDDYYKYKMNKEDNRNYRKSLSRSYSRHRSRSREAQRTKGYREREKDRRKKSYSRKSDSDYRKANINQTIADGLRQIEEAESFDRTILMYGFPNEVNEKKIFNFFASFDVLPIIDIKLLRDPRTRRSKNCCYVEFDTKDRARQAVNLTGNLICGQPCQIVPSQAEKNRQALATRLKKEKDQANNPGLMNNIVKYSKSNEQIDVNDAPMKIYVGGLTENLANITEDDLCNIFGFGEIDSIELHKDPITGRSKGYAFIQFHRGSKAKEVIQAMNGFIYQGKALKVGEANENNTVIKGKMFLAKQQQQQQLQQQQLQQQMQMLNQQQLDQQGQGQNITENPQVEVK